MKTAINANRLRCAEISAILAEQKRDFFVHGIEQPMGVRVTLEAELARLRYETLKLGQCIKCKPEEIGRVQGAMRKYVELHKINATVRTIKNYGDGMGRVWMLAVEKKLKVAA